MATKSFVQNPAESFFSAESIKNADAEERRKTEAAPEAARAEEKELPLGYHLAPETRSKRVALQVAPSVFNALKKKAEAGGISTNELINRVLMKYLEA